jgi:hypothetical protein
VDELGLTEEDFGRVLAACRLLRLGDDTPGYLREFLALRLEEASCAELAARVRGFTDGQMEVLAARIRQEQRRGGA